MAQLQRCHTRNEEKLYVGDRVASGERHGTVMFIGPVSFAKEGQVLVGLALDIKRSNSQNDGKVEGNRYFRCKPGHAQFVHEDEVELLSPPGGASGDSAPLFLETELQQLVGCESAKEALRCARDTLEVNERRSAAGGMAERCPHMVVSGPPGSGVSTWGKVAARLAHSADCTRKGQLITTSAQPGAGLVSASRSGSLEAVAKCVKDAAGGVLFIDDAHALLTNPSGGGESTGSDVLQVLTRESERQRGVAASEAMVIVLAGETAAMASLLRSPLGASLGISASAANHGSEGSQHISLGGFTAPECLELLQAMAEAKGFTLERGALRSAELNEVMEDMCRRSSKGQASTRQVSGLLEAAVAAQTRRVHASGTMSKGGLTTLLVEDFMASSKGAGRAGSTGDGSGELSAMLLLRDVIGLAEVKKFVKSLQAQLLLDEQRRQSGLPPLSTGALHMIFAGNPGTGKTTVARIVASLLKELGILSSGHLVEVDRASLVAGYVGQTAIKVTNAVKDAMGGILFVDEAYTLVQGDKDAFGREALDTLMKLMEDHREELIVVFAGYSEEMDSLLSANPGLRSRFPTSILFENYGASELMEICHGMMAKERLSLSPGAAELVQVALEAVAAKAATGDRRAANGRAVRNLIEAAKRNQALRLSDAAAAGKQASLQELTQLVEGDVSFATDPAWVTGS